MKTAFGHTFTRNFGGQFSVAILRSSFGELLLGELLGAWDSSSGAASGMSFGEQISGTIWGAALRRTFWDNCGAQLHPEQLSMTPLANSFRGATLGNHFGKEFLITILGTYLIARKKPRISEDIINCLYLWFFYF